jgi:transaldolase / glucose-6-phosphate isomerase
MGLDFEEFLRRAQEMVHACKSHLPAENPGAILGTILGVCNKNGRDKLTIFTSPEIYDLGAWLEQLIAESTGKAGKSIIPVDLEEIGKPEAYGDDRVFAYIRLKDSTDDQLDEKVSLLESKGFAVVRIVLEDKMNLGQEFYRWEFATAVAGAIMQINPFNQPDVEAAKVEARKLTEEYEESGKLPDETPFYEESGIRLFTSKEYAAELDEYIKGEKSLKKYLESHLAHLQENDYFALLAILRFWRTLKEMKNIRNFCKRFVTKFLNRSWSPLVLDSARVFFTRPDRHIKAEQITACFCKSRPTTRKISRFRGKNTLSAW